MGLARTGRLVAQAVHLGRLAANGRPREVSRPPAQRTELCARPESWLFTLLKVLFNLLPRPVTARMMATAIRSDQQSRIRRLRRRARTSGAREAGCGCSRTLRLPSVMRCRTPSPCPTHPVWPVDDHELDPQYGPSERSERGMPGMPIRSLARDEAGPDGRHDGLCTVGGAQLLVDLGDVGLGRRLADVQLPSDGGHPKALGQEDQDLPFAGRQASGRSAPSFGAWRRRGWRR